MKVKFHNKLKQKSEIIQELKSKLTTYLHSIETESGGKGIRVTKNLLGKKARFYLEKGFEE